MALIALSCAAARAGAAESLASAEEAIERCGGQREMLDKGQVVVVDQQPAGGDGVAVRACGIIDASPAAVWPVLRDCEEYEYFLPGVGRSVLESRTGNVALCDESIDLPFPLGDLHSVSRVVETARADGGFERRWSLVRGTYQRLEGAWTVLPWDASRARTLAIYDLDMNPETIIPTFMLRRVQSSTAPNVFTAIRARVRRCAGTGAGKPCRGK